MKRDFGRMGVNNQEWRITTDDREMLTRKEQTHRIKWHGPNHSLTEHGDGEDILSKQQIIVTVVSSIGKYKHWPILGLLLKPLALISSTSPELALYQRVRRIVFCCPQCFKISPLRTMYCRYNDGIWILCIWNIPIQLLNTYALTH